LIVLERAETQPSGSARSATGHRFGKRRLRELLAARGEAGLWLAKDDDGDETLLRLYPGLPKLEEWHTLELAASQLAYAVDSRLVPITEIALDIWPRLSFACARVESLSQRIAREPMAPEAAVAMCADVTGALAALARAGVPPVDISPADIVLADGRARLLADVGLPGGKLAHACVDLDHLAPERVAAIADRAQGIAAARPGGGAPTAASMTYALASIVAAAIHGPQQGLAPTALNVRLEHVLRRGLAHSPSERYGTPAALVEALGDAIGVDLSHSGVRAPHAHRVRAARAAVTQRRTTTEDRRLRFAIPVAVAVVAAAIGVAVGSASTPSDPPPAVTLAGAGLRVQAPQGWLRGRASDAPSAIGAPALVAHPPSSSATALVVTRAAAPLLTQLADVKPEPMRLGVNDAWRYRAVAVDRERVADVYVLEDGDGPIVAACVGPSDAAASARVRCAAALTTLQLHGGRAAALGGDASARRDLARVVHDLNQVRSSERHALAVAATGRRQAAAADRLAAAYARATERTGRIATVGAPGDLPRLVDRLQQAGHAYAALATAARGAHRTAYAQARERIVAGEHALAQALAALAPASARP
jgi:hypothetical protein